MRVRRKPAESGTCAADLCSDIVEAARHPTVDGEITVRAFCPAHSLERDLELSVRNAGGETADVLALADWERGPDGRARRRSDGNGIVD